MFPNQHSATRREISSARIAIRGCDNNHNYKEGVEKLAMEHYNLCTLMMYQRIIDYREKHPPTVMIRTEKTKDNEVIPVVSLDSGSGLAVNHPADDIVSPSILLLSEEEYDAIFEIDL
jgi:hypothetical protein